MVVGFRGSSNLANDVEDAAFLLLPPMQVSRQHDCTTAWPAGGARAHWLRLCVDFAYGSVRNVTQDAVTRALDSCGSACTEVTFTGHSLGSAMTTRRRAVDFQAHQQRRQLQAAGGGGAPARAVVSNLFTFGSPRVGNEAFAAWASGLLDIGLSSRVTREGDEVPRILPKVVPLRGGNRYQHVHTREVWNRHNTVPTRATWPASSTGSSSATRRTGRIITAPTQSPYARTSSGRRATRAAVSIATTSACWAGALLTLRWRWLRRTAACACAVATGPAPGNELCIL